MIQAKSQLRGSMQSRSTAQESQAQETTAAILQTLTLSIIVIRLISIIVVIMLFLPQEFWYYLNDGVYGSFLEVTVCGYSPLQPYLLKVCGLQSSLYIAMVHCCAAQSSGPFSPMLLYFHRSILVHCTGANCMVQHVVHMT